MTAIVNEASKHKNRTINDAHGLREEPSNRSKGKGGRIVVSNDESVSESPGYRRITTQKMFEETRPINPASIRAAKAHSPHTKEPRLAN